MSGGGSGIMSDWQTIESAPKDGTFVLLHNAAWPTDVEGFWHRPSQAWSANVRIRDIENRVVGPAPPTHWKPLTPDQQRY
jgi:hypothetical protein